MLINGRPAESISVRDRGLAYGDGLFETVRVIEEKPVLLDAHLARLEKGCRLLGIPAPVEECRSDMATLVTGGDMTDSVVKIIVTRGEQDRGYRPGRSIRPNRIVSIARYERDTDAWRRGIKAMVCKTRLGLNPGLAGIKHLNRLEQVLASGELTDDCREGLMMNGAGDPVEGIRTNFFVVERGRLATPPLVECGVAGTMREWLIARAAASVERMTMATLLDADEIFVCNSVIGIWPVIELSAPAGASRAFGIGEMTRSLQDLVTRETGISA